MQAVSTGYGSPDKLYAKILYIELPGTGWEV